MNDIALMLGYALEGRSKTEFCRNHKISMVRFQAMERGEIEVNKSLHKLIKRLFDIRNTEERLAQLRAKYREKYEIAIPGKVLDITVFDAGEDVIIPNRKGGAGGGSNNSGPISVTDIYC